MEVLFKNSYTRNKELAKEFYRAFFFRGKLLWSVYVLMALSFLVNIVFVLIGEDYNIGVLIFVPLFIAFLVFSYFSQVKSMIRRDAEIYGKRVDVETVVTDSFIQITASTGEVGKIEYDKIKDAIQTKNMILLRSKAKLVYIFRKDTFEIGTKEDFIAFLKIKGIKIKGRG